MCISLILNKIEQFYAPHNDCYRWVVKDGTQLTRRNTRIVCRFTPKFTIYAFCMCVLKQFYLLLALLNQDQTNEKGVSVY